MDRRTGGTGDASARLFLDNPAMDGTAKLTPAFVGTDRSDTTWSETMLFNDDWLCFAA